MTTSAEFSLRACAAFGVRIRLDGDDLIYEADYAPVPRALIDKLARDKAEIIALLRQVPVPEPHQRKSSIQRHKKRRPPAFFVSAYAWHGRLRSELSGAWRRQSSFASNVSLEDGSIPLALLPSPDNLSDA